MAALRNHSFFGIEKFNRVIANSHHELYIYPFQKMGGDYRNLYETIDQPALKLLSTMAYGYAEWKKSQIYWTITSTL